MEFDWVATAVEWTAQVCISIATVGCVYLLVATLLVQRFGRRRLRTARVQVPVSVLKPLHGEEPELLERLSQLCRQTYSAPVQILFGTQDCADPAIRTVEALRERFPQAAIELHVDARGHGPNRKMSNLANMAAYVRHPLVVMADSDIETGPDYLAQVVGELQQPGVGAVTCLYYGVAKGGPWARLAALATNTHFLPNVVVATSFRLARPCFGATIAMTRQTLDRIGGPAAFAHCLADDYAIGEAVRANGDAVVVPPLAVGHVCAQASARELLGDESRQGRTIRTLDPVGYLGSVIGHPLPLALIAWALGSEAAPLVGIVALALRALLCRTVERNFGLGPQAYWLLPVRDLISFAVYVWSFCGATVRWRGHRYHALSDGTLVRDRS